jgi:hypothetical protein
MQSSNLTDQLAKLDAKDAERCLHILLKQFAEQDPAIAGALGSPDELRDAIATAAADLGNDVGAVHELAGTEREDAVRLVLAALVERDDTRPRVQGALTNLRHTRVDPVTAAVVLAGVVLVLSTEFEIQYEDVDGKKKLKLLIRKKATPPAILAKLFALFK